MIYHRCLGEFSFCFASYTQRMCFQVTASGSSPAAVIPTPGRCNPVAAAQSFMFLTVKSCCHFRTSWMFTGFLRLHRHIFITTSFFRYNSGLRYPSDDALADSVTAPPLFSAIPDVSRLSYGIHRISLHRPLRSTRYIFHPHSWQNNPSSSPFHPLCIKRGSSERMKHAALCEGYKKSPMDSSTELLTLLRSLKITQIPINLQ